ncbi:MAG: radical SAM protein [Kiritimatiellaeota bacterium]|nr:radical SAM protein [Kiritimatiellota bacterium]
MTSDLDMRRTARPLPLRLMREVRSNALRRFVFGAGVGNLLALRKFKRRKKHGKIFPPIVFVSATQRCNLSCRGCWATGAANPADISADLLDKIVRESRTQGCRFFGILGGEPLLLPWLPDFFAAHRNSYFQLFTNGRFLDDAVAQRLAAAGNVSPLISVEGVGPSYLARRDDSGMYAAALGAIECCRKAGLVQGVATSVSVSNFKDTVSPAFIDEMLARGAHYVWYYIYRPSGPNPGFEDILTDGHVRDLRRFLVEQRRRVRSGVIIDTYWDERGNALCPTAAGINVHIAATGDIEPCPPVQCSDCCVTMHGDTVAAVEGSAMLRAFQAEVPTVTDGCVLMDHPQALLRFAARHNAKDSSGRGSFFDELSQRPVCNCHNHSGDPIPEPTWMYRLAKKTLFFGFGAYG